MKSKMITTFLLLMTLSTMSYANGGPYSSGVEEASTEKEEYQSEQETQERSISTEKTRQRMEENPRNPAMVDSFEKVETEKQRKEKRK